MCMKIHLFLSFLLCSCALLPSKFDPVLYGHLVEIATQTDQAQLLCGTPDEKAAVFALNRQTKLLSKYVQYTDNDVKSSINYIDKAVTEMNNAYTAGTPSTGYCQLKLKLVGGELDEVLTGYGGKAR